VQSSKYFPILNIDGVIAGNYRTSFAGLDINRMFGENANKRLNPEANMLKDFAKKETRLAFYFDIHGHSSKKSVFMLRTTISFAFRALLKN